MDQGSLVIQEIDAGRNSFVGSIKTPRSRPRSGSRRGAEGRWYLYIASDKIEDKKLRQTYGQVLRLADQMNSPYLDPFQVKLIPASDPLAEAALTIHRRYPGNSATRFGGTNFGGMGVEAVYIYPSSVTSSTSEAV